MRYKLLFTMSFSCALLFGAVQSGYAQDSGDVLIQNVHLIDRQGVLEDVVVNILIKGNQLNVVTQEQIPASEAGLTVDASNGFLFGKMEIGAPPSFIILDQDPRENFDVLLDTGAHLQFAVKKGVVVKNNLPQVVAAKPGADEKAIRSGWLAYDPPPLALPLSYHDSRKWNRFKTKYISGLFVGAMVLDRQVWTSQDAASVAQVGDLDEFEGGEIRALRLGLIGTLNFKNPWIYTIYGATNAFDKGFDTDTTDDVSWYDYRLDIPLFTNTTLSIGKQKEPISMERLMGLAYLPWQERSAAGDAFLPARNHGIVLNGTGFDSRMTWGIGAFNNWIDTDESFSDTANAFVGRTTWMPFASTDESNLLHLGFGVRHSDAKQGIRYSTEPEFNQAPVFVDTGLLSANSALTYDVEASWRKGPFWLGFEYIKSDLDSPETGDPSFDGYHLSASWAISGEMREYNRRSGTFRPLRVARAVNQGGWGAWEAGLRWSSIDLTDGPVDGGGMDILSVGLNWWLTQVWSYGMNYRHVTSSQGGIEGSSSGFTGRITLILD